MLLREWMGPMPEARVLAATHMERWLQSPALAGAARSLLASIPEALRASPSRTPRTGSQQAEIGEGKREEERTHEQTESADDRTVWLLVSMRLKSNQTNLFVDTVLSLLRIHLDQEAAAEAKTMEGDQRGSSLCRRILGSALRADLGLPHGSQSQQAHPSQPVPASLPAAPSAFPLLRAVARPIW